MSVRNKPVGFLTTGGYMRNVRFLLYGFFFLCFIGPIYPQTATAIELPYNKGFDGKIDDKQYAETRVIIEATGKAHVATKFSNGKRVDGDTFIAITLFYSDTNTVIAGVKQRKGVNAAGTSGAAKTGSVETPLTIPTDILSKIKSVQVFYGHQDKVNDKAVWEALQAALQALWASGDSAFKIFESGVKI
jgi:hypothetical protein